MNISNYFQFNESLALEMDLSEYKWQKMLVNIVFRYKLKTLLIFHADLLHIVK